MLVSLWNLTGLFIFASLRTTCFTIHFNKPQRQHTVNGDLICCIEVLFWRIAHIIITSHVASFKSASSWQRPYAWHCISFSNESERDPTNLHPHHFPIMKPDSSAGHWKSGFLIKLLDTLWPALLSFNKRPAKLQCLSAIMRQAPYNRRHLTPLGIAHTVRCRYKTVLKWRHNERDGVSNHQPHDCLLNHLFRHRSKKTSKLRVTGLCEGIHRWPVNSPHIMVNFRTDPHNPHPIVPPWGRHVGCRLWV